MKLTLPRLSVQKGSSIATRIPIEMEANDSLLGFRASAYVKAMASDGKIICILDAKINTENKTVEISVGPPRSDVIPAGLLTLCVELTRGATDKVVGRNYFNVEP